MGVEENVLKRKASDSINSHVVVSNSCTGNGGSSGGVKRFLKRLKKFTKKATTARPPSSPDTPPTLPLKGGKVDIAMSSPIPAPQEIVMTTDVDSEDDISTLAEPPQQTGVISSNEARVAYYGDQSISTETDMSRSNGYYGRGDSSFSSAGVTLTTRGGFETIGTSTYMHGLSSPSVVSDDSFFDTHYNSSAFKEEVLTIMAPPGKLGISIDTPSGGDPVIFSIKEISPIKDSVQVGDYLVALDDEDVRCFTAVKIAKLISKKSGNEWRKLTIIRVVEEDRSVA